MTKTLNLSDEVVTGGVAEDDYDANTDEIPSDTLDFLAKMYETDDSDDIVVNNSRRRLVDREKKREKPVAKTEHEFDEDDTDDTEEDDVVIEDSDMFTGLEDGEDEITKLQDDDIIRPKQSKKIALEKDDSDTGDNESYGSKISKDQIKVIVILVLLFVVGFIGWLILPKAPTKVDKGKDKGAGSSVSEQAQTEPVKEVVKEKIVYKYEEPPKQYFEYVDLPDKYYSDRVVISKFSTTADSTVAFYFMGIPENFKKKIVFPVSVETYNQVANGSVISIDYKVTSVDGSDYVIDVVTNVGGI